MSFNVRVDVYGDGINAFTNRFDRVIGMINTEDPDVIGFQEVNAKMRTRLRRALTDYVIIGCGRDSDCHGESALIAYRESNIELISLDSVWLSPTPHLPGSSFGGDQSIYPRMVTTALFKHDALTDPFRFVNTHLDHSGKNARYLGMTEIVQMISTYKEKFVLTGDFNALPNSPEIALISSALTDKGVIDCTKDIKGTFHGFGKFDISDMLKIDYIFTDGACKKAYAVADEPIDGQYYSDHNAVCALISL